MLSELLNHHTAPPQFDCPTCGGAATYDLTAAVTTLLSALTGADRATSRKDA